VTTVAEVLEIDLKPRIKGRAVRPLTAVAVRPLTQSDLAKLKVERGVKPVQLQRIRDSHHFLARYLALGATPAEASATTGYSTVRISILLTDPAFQELLSFYRDHRNEKYFNAKTHFEERLMANMLTAESILTERMEDDPEKLSDSFLNRYVTDRADRLGFGPTSKSSNLNVLVDATQLQQVKDRLHQHLENRDLGALEFHHQQGGDSILPEVITLEASAPTEQNPAPVEASRQPDATAGAGLEKPRLGVLDDDRR